MVRGLKLEKGFSMTPINSGAARPNTAQILESLASGLWVIAFTKKSGESRIYLGTRDGSKIPQDTITGADTRRDTGGFVAFYAFQKLDGDAWQEVESGRKAWKSFAPDNLVALTEHKE